MAFAADLPAWVEALRDVAGPLLAAAMDFAHWRGPVAFPDGRAGIRRLGNLVDDAAFDDTMSDDDDTRFVQGAGAMLALLLISHVGRGRHRVRDGRHAIELGEFGFFDPFDAVDAVLDAERPSAELAQRIMVAEAEAAGEGAYAKTTHAVLSALAAPGPPGAPDARLVRERFGPHLSFTDGLELDLSRFVALAQDDAADFSGSIERLVSMLRARDTHAVAPWSEASSRILPRLASPGFIAELAHTGGSPLASRPIADGLCCALVLAYEGRLRFVREREVERWIVHEGVDPYSVAFAQLEERVVSTRWRADTLGDRVSYVATRRDGLAATLLLAASLRAELARRIAPSFVVALPHRDMLVASAMDGELDLMAASVRDEYLRAPHGISGSLYVVHVGESTELAIEAWR